MIINNITQKIKVEIPDICGNSPDEGGNYIMKTKWYKAILPYNYNIICRNNEGSLVPNIINFNGIPGYDNVEPNFNKEKITGRFRVRLYHTFTDYLDNSVDTISDFYFNCVKVDDNLMYLPSNSDSTNVDIIFRRGHYLSSTIYNTHILSTDGSTVIPKTMCVYVFDDAVIDLTNPSSININAIVSTTNDVNVYVDMIEVAVEFVEVVKNV